MKIIAFHVLNSFRGLIQLALRLGLGVAMIMLLILFVREGLTLDAVGAFLWVVGLGAASFHYDALLLRLAPSAAGDDAR